MTVTDVLAPLPVVLPLLAAAITLVLGRFARTQRVISLVALTAVVGIAVVLLVQADRTGSTAVAVGDWPAPQAIVLVVDRLSALMVLVATVVALGVLVFAVGQGITSGAQGSPVSIFQPTYLVLVSGVSLSFLAGDLFNLYVGFEVLLTASYVLITLGGSAPRIRGGITYIMVSLVGSLLFLAAIALVYAATGTVNMAQLSERLGDLPAGTQGLLHAMLLVGFGVKAAVFPLSTWLPDSYPTAPAPVTAVFAGLLTKVGIYALIRTETLLFPGPALDTLLMWAALVTMLIGILGALAQTDIRRMLSFTLVSHIGYMLFGISLSTTAGLSGAIFYVVHHIVIQTTLFLVAALVDRQGGATSVLRLGGLAAASPLLGVLFFVPAMNLAGIPPMSGFLGKLSLLEAGVAAGGRLPYVLVAVAVLTSLLTLLAVSRIWSRAFWRPREPDPIGDPSAPAADVAAALGSERRRGWRRTLAAATGGDADLDTVARQHKQQEDGPSGRGGGVAVDSDPPEEGAGADESSLPRVLTATTAALVGLSLSITLIAGPLFGLTDRAARDLIDRTPYVSSVQQEADR